MDEKYTASKVDGDIFEAPPKLDQFDNEHGFRFIFDHSLLGIVILDPDGVFKLVNRAFCKLLDRDNDEIVGKTIYDFTHPDDMEMSRKIRSAIKQGTGAPAEFEKRFVRKDGTAIWVWVTQTLVSDSSGKLTYSISQVRDITEKKFQFEQFDRQRVLFEAVFRDVPDAMTLVDPDRIVTAINPAFTRIFGVEENDVIGETTATFYADEEEYVRQGRIRYNMRAEEKLNPYIVSYRRTNGEIFPGETVGSIIKDNQGKILGYIGVIRDISDRIEAQKKIEENEALFRDFANAAADRFWQTDEEHRFTYVTPNTEEFPQDTIGLNGKLRWEIEQFEADPEEWKKYKDCVNARENIRDFRFRYKHENGKIFYRRSSGVPFFDEDGVFKGYRGTTSDETAQVLAQVEARSMQEQFHSAVEHFDTGFVLWDADKKFIACNSYYAKMMKPQSDDFEPGYPMERMLKERAKNIFSPDDPRHRTWIKDRLADLDKPLVNLEYKTIANRWFWIRLQKLADGSTIGFHTEITKTKEREEELNQARIIAESANRAKSEFLANVSHELRTPLNAILGFAQVFEQRPESMTPEKLVKFGGVIIDSGKHLRDLINDILNLSAIEAGKSVLSEEKVGLAQIAEDSIRLVNHRAEEKNIALVKSKENNAPVVNVDAVKIKQVLVNILTNAIKFTETGGQIAFSSDRDEDGRVVIRISDTGIGMKAEEIEMAMEMFGRVKQKSSKEKEGSGLGLPLAKGLIETHGGAIEIESEPGVGTTVTITLPANRVVEKSLAKNKS